MPPELAAFWHDIQTKNWFAIAALTIMVGIQIFRSPVVAQSVWLKIPQGYRFLPAVLLSAGTAFVHGYLARESFGASMWDALKIALTAMGGAAALKESPLPWDGLAGGAPAPLALGPAPALAPIRSIPDLVSEDDRLTPVDPSLPPSDPPPPPRAA